MRRGRRLGWYAIAALAFGAAAAWILLPDNAAPDGLSIRDRASQASSTGAQALSQRVIADDDLPPPGTRSLFDHLIAQNENLPFPFERLIELIRRQDPAGKAPPAVMIPAGRSLLKAQADFERPRVLVAADFQGASSSAALAPMPRAQLFLGFVENAGEIEVISYNEAAGRFEFQLVQDYCEGCTPRIVYARRAVCTTCHQGAAPIFPQRPWSETNATPEISSRIAAARPDATYLGLPTQIGIGVTERFDELTDTANFMPVMQRIWLDGCGVGAPGAGCRRELLELALLFAWNPGSFDASGSEAARLRQLQAVAWPAAGIRVPEPDIRNRDPLAEQRGLRGWLRTLMARRHASGAAPKSNEDLEAFDRLPKLPAELDPIVPRPPRRALSAQDVDGVSGLAQFFGPADVRVLETAAGFEFARLAAAVEAMDADLFGETPFSRVKVLTALLVALGQPAPSYCCLDTAEMSAPALVGGPPLAVAASSPLKPFETYCFACHRGNPAKRLNFMAGTSEAEVLEAIRGTGAIRDVLDWERYRGTDKESTLMPPADSHQRRLLEVDLARNPKLLEQMREQVPALFDF